MAIGGLAAAGDTAVKMLGPGARQGTDVQGNPIVVHPNGSVAYLQKPGTLLSRSQVIGGIGELPALGAALAAGGIPALAGRGIVNTIARSAINAGVQGGLNLGAQFGSRSLGSDQGINLPNAVSAGVMGGLAEPTALLATKLGIGVPTAAYRAARGGPQFLTRNAAGLPADTQLDWSHLTPQAQVYSGNYNPPMNCREDLPPDPTTERHSSAGSNGHRPSAAGQQMASDPEILRRTLPLRRAVQRADHAWPGDRQPRPTERARTCCGRAGDHGDRAGQSGVR